MDKILLRFRDLTQNINTIEVHNEIAKKYGSVYWGWWKKDNEPFPDPMLSELSEDIKRLKDICIYFIDSDSGQYYKAPLYDILYTPGQSRTCIPKDSLAMCPEYYREKELPAWFEIGVIEKVSRQELSQYVLSSKNRTTRHYNSIPQQDIGNFINDINILSHPVSIWFFCTVNEFDSLGTRSIHNISSGSYPTKGKYILHLSDLHFGEHHAYKNPLATSQPTSKEPLIHELIDDLKCLGENFLNEIALVIITGDLTWAANPHEFSNANSFIAQLKQELGLGSEHVIVVPGNHDIEWINNFGKIDTNAELNYRNFYKELYSSSPLDSILKINRYKVGTTNLCIVALNSCRLESPENAGYGYIGSDQLRILQEYFERNQDIDYKIAVLHHHVLPVNYIEEYDPKSKKVSMLLDAESVMQSLVSCGVNTVLHGHQHQPYYTTIKRIVPEYIKNGKKTRLEGCLNIIGAGSLGVSQTKLNTIGRNSYNVLHIEDNYISVQTRIKSSNGVGFYSDPDVLL